MHTFEPKIVLSPGWLLTLASWAQAYHPLCWLAPPPRAARAPHSGLQAHRSPEHGTAQQIFSACTCFACSKGHFSSACVCAQPIPCMHGSSAHGMSSWPGAFNHGSTSYLRDLIRQHLPLPVLPMLFLLLFALHVLARGLIILLVVPAPACMPVAVRDRLPCLRVKTAEILRDRESSVSSSSCHQKRVPSNHAAVGKLLLRRMHPFQ